MTLQDLDRISTYSATKPGLRVLVMAIAKAIGIEINIDSAPAEKKYMTAEEFMRMVRMTGGKIDGLARR